MLYISANLCKRGIVLNLKDPRDLERAYRLAERDVFIENFRVGVVERLGLGYQVLAERNPRLIYCSISGFGRHGPLALLPSVDPYIQAFSGFASLQWQSRQSGREFTQHRFYRPQHLGPHRPSDSRRPGGARADRDGSTHRGFHA